MATEASLYLIELAKQLAQPYIALPQIRAAILTGSASEGESDFYSDLDIILYYETMPPEPVFAAAYEQNGGQEYRVYSPYDENGFMDFYQVKGIECQFGHNTVAGWERDIASVLEGLDVTSPLQKALGGMEHAIPLYGGELVQQWKDRLAAYPDALAEAMVKHYLAFFPLWGLLDRFTSRDATIWIQESLVSIAQNLLGVMAGLNRQYYTTFQFKRMHRFIDSMTIKPADFAARIEALFRAEPSEAAKQAESLVAETLALVKQHMPQIDISRPQARIGWQQPKWTIQSHHS
jgi:hypothetical protein